MEKPRSRFTEWLVVRDIRFLLTRRIVEIRDGFLAIRDYRSPGVENRATAMGERHGYSGEKLRMVVEAAVLADALEAKRSGRSPEGVGTVPEREIEKLDVSTEIGWLVGVADAFIRSPVVAEVVAEARRGRPTTEDPHV
ncbi:DUF6545 domain-containing protein [Sinosporangium album]